MINYYNVAEHVFGIEASEVQLAQLTNYVPFQLSITRNEVNRAFVAENNQSPIFTIRVQEAPLPSADQWEHVYTDKSDDDMPRIEMYRRDDAWMFRISMYRDSDVVSAMECSADWQEVKLYMATQYTRFAIDNAAMLVYAFATADKKILLFHSSVTVRNGKGYMFLGHSGTGKSTHSQQWLTAFEDAHLLNDDNPVVRLMDDSKVIVYGSPWSGKTPCYKNECAQVGALVQLAQAPQNVITKLRMTQAYPYILASVSGLKVLPQMMDRLYESIAQLLECVSVYKLECLPNPDAARLCAQTCSL